MKEKETKRSIRRAHSKLTQFQPWAQDVQAHRHALRPEYTIEPRPETT
jgi:hypothetical protein